MGALASAQTTKKRIQATRCAGSYVGGVYYPDKTKVGWWKNGYPEYFAKVLNAPDWTTIRLCANGEELDLATHAPLHFRRELDMLRGLLTRTFEVSVGGMHLSVKAQRFCSMADVETAYPTLFSGCFGRQRQLDAGTGHGWGRHQRRCQLGRAVLGGERCKR